jgi:hypothetical protein
MNTKRVLELAVVYFNLWLDSQEDKECSSLTKAFRPRLGSAI